MAKHNFQAAFAAVVLAVSVPGVGSAASAPTAQAQIESLTARLVSALKRVASQGLAGDVLAKAYQDQLESAIIASGSLPVTVLAALDSVPATNADERAAIVVVRARIKKASVAALRPTAFGGVLSGFPGDGGASRSSGGGSDYRRP
ncbi:hypothetical protein [Caulobacter sp. DWP3-1-3b2]|uniref:hypothetical protein n=1 Tax=Caulobacter sp. DWP3-1-3b2 TaxID=2804643 RepID=UPI003CE9CA9A